MADLRRLLQVRVLQNQKDTWMSLYLNMGAKQRDDKMPAELVADTDKVYLWEVLIR